MRKCWVILKTLFSTSLMTWVIYVFMKINKPYTLGHHWWQVLIDVSPNHYLNQCWLRHMRLLLCNTTSVNHNDTFAISIFSMWYIRLFPWSSTPWHVTCWCIMTDNQNKTVLMYTASWEYNYMTWDNVLYNNKRYMNTCTADILT